MNNYNYIGATANFPINDYIDYTSNTNFIYTSNTSNYLNKRIDDIDIETSNISSNISDIYTQKLRNELWEVNPNNSKCLIKSIPDYNNNIHTYIINSNIYGEIRFKNIYTGDNSRVIIDKFGKLNVYHIFDLLKPSISEGWKDVENEITNLIILSQINGAEIIVVQGQIAGIDASINFILGELTSLAAYNRAINLNLETLSYGIFNNDAYQTLVTDIFTDLTGYYSSMVNQFSAIAVSTRVSQFTTGILVPAGVTSVIGSIIYAYDMSSIHNLTSNILNSNVNLNASQRREILEASSNLIKDNYNSLNSNFSNMSLEQGFINSNIITTQYIPSLKSNKIMLGSITTPNSSYDLEMSGDLNLNMLYLNSTSLSSLLNQKQGNLTFTQPLYNTTNTIGLNYDSSLTKVANNLSVVKTASLPLSISAAHNFSLNYDSTLELSGNNLKVAAATASKWTQSGNNIYNNNGNVGVGNINPQKKLHITHTNNDLIRIETDTNNVNQTSGIEFGIPAFASATRSKITSTTYSGDASDIQFYTSSSANASTSRMTISSSGNIGINTNNASYKLHIEDGSMFIGDSSIGNGSQIDNGYKLIFDSSYTATGANKCNKIILHKNDTAPTYIAGFGIEAQGLAYSVWTGAYHNFYTSVTTSSGGYLSCSIYRDNFRFYGSTNAGAGGVISNGNNGNSAYSYVSLANDTGNGILFLNSSTKTTDGGANCLTLRNDVTGGDLRLSANLDTPYIFLKKSTGNVGIDTTAPAYKLTINGSLGCGAINSTSITTNNNAINAGTGGLTCGAISSGTITTNNNTITAGTATITAATFSGKINPTVNTWNTSSDGYNRFYFANTSRTYFSSGSGFEWRHSTDAGIAVMSTIGQLGLDNLSPIGLLSLGDSSKVGSDGSLVIHKNSGSGNQRHMKMGFYTSTFDLTIGDFGNNNVPGTWVKTFYIAWNAPNTSLAVLSNGIVYTYYGFQSASDMKLKTDIKTIENALWKVEQLRGVEYNHIITKDKNIGLIAQEVEHIVPEVIGYNEETDTKTINYNGMIGLLVEAVKDLKEEINNLNKRIEILETK